VRQALDSSPALSSLYVGYANGDFFLVGRIGHGAESEAARAPAGATYVVQSIEQAGGKPRGRFIYLDADLQTLRDDDRPDYAAAYDPRQRIWFTQAMASPAQIATPPYVFFSSRQVGLTLANRSGDRQAVAGADILLHSLGQTLAQQKATPGNELVIVDADGYALAYEDVASLVRLRPRPTASPSLARLDELGVPALIPLLASVRQRAENPLAREPSTLRIDIDGTPWRASISPLAKDDLPPLYMVTAVPESELMAGAMQLIERSAMATVLVLLLTIPFTWGLARSISRSLSRLASEADKIRHFDFSEAIAANSAIKEVNQLAETMEAMKRTIRRFLDISHAVAAEQNFDRLLPQLLAETLSASEARAGILYLADGHS
jgi:HAMP domain-containing protein